MKGWKRKGTCETLKRMMTLNLEPEQDKVLVMPRSMSLVQYQAIMPPSNENEHNEKDPLNQTSYTMNPV